MFVENKTTNTAPCDPVKNKNPLEYLPCIITDSTILRYTNLWTRYVEVWSCKKKVI